MLQDIPQWIHLCSNQRLRGFLSATFGWWMYFPEAFSIRYKIICVDEYSQVQERDTEIQLADIHLKLSSSDF